jgi:hypothetical protein
VAEGFDARPLPHRHGDHRLPVQRADGTGRGRLVANDTGWSYGAGPLVSGPALSLLLAMTGRAAGMSELTGDGAATLGRRL